MRMDHALRMASAPARVEDILSAAERLARPDLPAAMSPLAPTGQPPDNGATVRACTALLRRTISLLR